MRLKDNISILNLLIRGLTMASSPTLPGEASVLIGLEFFARGIHCILVLFWNVNNLIDLS